MGGDRIACRATVEVGVLDDQRDVVLLAVAGGALAGHAVGAAEFAVVGREYDHRVVEEVLVVEFVEHGVDLAVALADAVQVVVLQALPPLVLVGHQPHEVATGLLVLVVCRGPTGFRPSFVACGGKR